MNCPHCGSKGTAQRRADGSGPVICLVCGPGNNPEFWETTEERLRRERDEARKERDRWKPDEQRLIELAADQVTPLCKSGNELAEQVERLQRELREAQGQIDARSQLKVERFQQQAEVGRRNNDRLRAELKEARAEVDKWKRLAWSRGRRERKRS